MRTKLPLELEDWRRVVRHLQSCKMKNEAMRHVLLIMALRGFRSGDVLRMRRTELARSLDTGKLVYEGEQSAMWMKVGDTMPTDLEGLEGP